MYGRFLTWQQDLPVSAQIESGPVNNFVVDSQCIDIRFNLKGYGFKRPGESNRVIYHFGTYKCFFRLIGEPDFTLFARVVSARARTVDPDVYKDVGVSTGLLPQGQYEIKIEADRLEELETWSTGLIEGISGGDRFYDDIECRTDRPIRLAVSEAIPIREFAAQGVTAIPMLAVDPDPLFFDPIQHAEVISIVLEHTIQEGEDFPVTDVLTIELLLDLRDPVEVKFADEFVQMFIAELFLTNTNPPIEQIDVQDVFAGFVTDDFFFVQDVFISEFAFLNVERAIIVSDGIQVVEFADLNKPFQRTVIESIFIDEFVVTNVERARIVFETITVTEVSTLNVERTIIVSDQVALFELPTLQRVGVVDVLVFVIDPEILDIFDIAFVKVARVIVKIEFILVVENATLAIDRLVSVFDEIAIDELALIVRPGEINRLEDIQVDETATIAVSVGVAEDDLITVVEVEALSVVIEANVSDLVSIVDVAFVTDLVIELGPVEDNITVDEFVLASLRAIVVFDVVDVIEAVTVTLPAIDAFEDIAVIENISVTLPAIFIVNVIQVNEFAPVDLVIAITPTDTAAIFEIVVLEVAIQVAVDDSIEVDEFIVVQDLVLDLFAFDSAVILIETVTLQIVLNTEVFEDIDVDEQAILTVQFEISESETITVVEVPTVSLDVLNVSGVEIVPTSDFAQITDLVIELGIVADILTVTEQATISLDVLNPSVFDPVAVVEDALLDFDLSVVVSDLVAAVEDVQVALDTIDLSATDTVTVDEAVTVLVFRIQVFDLIDVDEAVVVEIVPLEAEVEDGIDVQGALFDEIAVTEAITIDAPITQVEGQDEIGVQGGLFDTITASEFVSVEVI